MANNTEDVELRSGDHYSCQAMKIASMPGGGTTIGQVHDAIEALIQQEANRQKAELLDRLSDVDVDLDIKDYSQDYINGYSQACMKVSDFIEAERKQLERSEQ